MKPNSRFSMAVHLMTALVYLDEKSSSGLLSKSVNTNPVVIRRLLGELNRAGLIRAVRGKQGGFMLARDAKKISLLDIYRAVNGDEGLVSLHDNPENRACAVSCKVRGVLAKHLHKAQGVFERELGQVVLADIEKAM